MILQIDLTNTTGEVQVTQHLRKSLVFDYNKEDKTLENIDYSVSGKVTAKLVLGNFGNYKGTVKVVLPQGLLKDSSNNESESLEYTTVSVDFKKPEWNTTTSAVIMDGSETVEVYLEGTDDALTESLNELTVQDIEVYTENETVANTTISKELRDIVYTPVGTGVTKTKVNAILVLGNIKPYSGTLKVVLPEGTLVDTSGNTSDRLEHTTEVADFVKPAITNCVETKIDDDTLRYTFDLEEKYLDSTQDIKFEGNEIWVELNGTTEITNQITKSISYTNGANGVRNYTVTLSGFYAEGLSGYVNLIVKEHAVYDQSGNPSDKVVIGGTTLIDKLLPEYRYDYSSVSITGQDETAELLVKFSAEDGSKLIVNSLASPTKLSLFLNVKIYSEFILK